MKADFRRLANSFVRNLTPYQPGKPIEEVERELGISASIKLASNENLLGASPMALRAIQDSLAHTHFYPDGGCYEIKQMLATFLSVQPEQLTLGNGSENILELVVKAYLHKHDTAVISQYAFLTIPIILQSYGVEIISVPTNQWGHDVQQMIAAIDNRTRVIFLVNPNNPTGTYVNANDFHYLMEAIPSHILVVVDEAYHEYITVSDYPNTLAYINTHPNLLITRTFSKAYGLAALRLGYAISSPEVADILNRARLPFNVNSIAIKAACAALNDQEHVKKSLLHNQQGLQQLEEELAKLSIDFIPSVGNFITMHVKGALQTFQQLLQQGVIVRPLMAYDMPNHIRVTIGTSEQNERFLRSIKKVM